MIFERVAGHAVDQPSRLRTPPGVGPRCRRLGAQVSATRHKTDPYALRGTTTSKLGRNIDGVMPLTSPVGFAPRPVRGPAAGERITAEAHDDEGQAYRFHIANFGIAAV